MHLFVWHISSLIGNYCVKNFEKFIRTINDIVEADLIDFTFILVLKSLTTKLTHTKCLRNRELWVWSRIWAYQMYVWIFISKAPYSNLQNVHRVLHGYQYTYGTGTVRTHDAPSFFLFLRLVLLRYGSDTLRVRISVFFCWENEAFHEN